MRTFIFFFVVFVSLLQISSTLHVGPLDDWESLITNAESGSEIHFLAGVYHGDCNLQISKTVTLIGEAGPAHTIIDCRGSARHFKIRTNATLQVDGFTIMNGNSSGAVPQDWGGGCIAASADTQLMLRNAILKGCVSPAGGGAIFASQSVLVMDSVTLQDSVAGGSGGCISAIGSMVSMTDVTISGCMAGLHGGGISLVGSDLTMKGTHAESNSAGDKGGAVYGGDGSMVSVSFSTFHLNRAGEFMGAGQEVGYGGAVAVAHGSTLSIADSVTMTENEADFAGGGVFGYINCLVSIVGNVSIVRNVAGRRAGAAGVYLSHLNVHGSVLFAENGVGPMYTIGIDWLGGAMTGEFSTGSITGGVRCLRNWAQNGGCLFGWGWMQLEIGSDVQMNENIAWMGGGAMTLFGGGTLKLFDRVEMCNNWAEMGSGGSSYLHGEVGSWLDVQLSDGITVEGNFADWGGGGIWGRWVSMQTRGRVEIRNNTCESGGAFEMTFEATMALGPGLRVADNYVQQNGGGVSIHNREGFLDGRCEVNVSSGVVVEGNLSPWSGGGFALEACRLHMDGAVVRNNWAGRSGGGMRLSRGSNAVLVRVQFESNSASSGGAIALEFSNAEVRECQLQNCTASVDGGGMHTNGDSALTLTNTVVKHCRASGHGGGIASMDDSRIVLRSGVSVVGGWAGVRGGGLHLGGGRAEFAGDGIRVAENGAGKEGGGISYFSEVLFRSGRVDVAFNYAETGGGMAGVGWRAEARVVGERLSVEGNTAVHNGGGLALLDLARVAVQSPECPGSCAAVANNTYQEDWCFTPECNFDGGDYKDLFLRTGEAAVRPCDRSGYGCGLNTGEGLDTTDTKCLSACFTASCNWGDQTGQCTANRVRNAECPIWDAVALRSLETHAPALMFVKDGGPAKGVGRCAEPCRPGPAPPVPEWCQEPACHGNTSGWREEPWCNTLDDNLVPQGPNSDGGFLPAQAAVGGGLGPWGSCTDRKNLPHVGFDYDREALLATLGLSLPRLLQEYPACGKVPIVFAKNRAGGDGGGLYKSSCSLLPDLKDACFLGGIGGAMVVSFEENRAGAAGGGAYIACHKLGECDHEVQIPEVGGQSLHFEGNEAGTFGADVGSGPRELRLLRAVREYVPGQSMLSVSFELRDALGQALRSRSDHGLPFLVAFSVCAPEGPCDVGSALQATGYVAFKAGVGEGSTGDSQTVLQYCVLGQQTLRLRVELVGHESEDTDSTSKEIEVHCLPCHPLQKMVTVDLGGRRLWTCQACNAADYVLNVGGNDPEAQCHNCPVGAECVEGVLRGRVPGSTWEFDAEKRQMVLVSCPPGYQLSNTLDDDPGSPFLHDSQQCRRCGANQYIVNYTQPCRECPVGGDCDSVTMSPRVVGSRWEAVDGWLRLAECPPGFVIIRSKREGMELLDQCEMCPVGKYSRQPAVFTRSSGLVFEATDEARIEKMCFDCPSGADCEGSKVIPRKGFWVMGPENAGSRRELAHVKSELGVFPCQPFACEGGEENECSPGREGPVCGLCSAGYTLSPPRCVKCSNELNWVGRAFYVVIGCIAIVVCFFFVLRPILAGRNDRAEVQFSASGERQAVAFKSQPCSRLIEYMKQKRRGAMHLQRYLKVVVGFYQLLSSFLFTFPVNWSQGTADIMSYASLFTLDFMSLPGIACVTSDLSYEMRLIFRTIFPVLCLVGLLLPGLWFVASGRGQWQHGLSQMERAARREKAIDTMIHISLVWLFIIAPGVCRHSLQNFLCQELLGGVKLLTSDYSVSCPRDAPGSFLFVYSVCSSVLSVAGIPLVFFFALNAYSVPKLARAKMRDAGVREMIAMFKQQHCHDFNSLLVLLRLHVVDDLPTMEHCFLERCSQLYKEIADTNRGRVDAKGIEQLMTMTNTHCIESQTLIQIAETQCKDGAGGLTKMEFIGVMRVLLLENTAFTENESFASLNAEQVQRLLADKWQPQVLADRASAPSEPLSKLKSQLVVRIERLLLRGVLRPKPVEWNGESAGERKALESVGFLFEGYAVGVWYWDIVELLRKVFFVGFLPFIAEQRNVQLTVGFLLTSVFLLVASRVRPFKQEGVDSVYMWSNAALSLTLFYGHFADGDWPASFKSGMATLNVVVIFSVLFSPIIVQLFLSSWSPTLAARRCWPCPSQESAEMSEREPLSSGGRLVSFEGSDGLSTRDGESGLTESPDGSIQVAHFRLLQSLAGGNVEQSMGRSSAESNGVSVAGEQHEPKQHGAQDSTRADRARTGSGSDIVSRLDRAHLTVDTGFVSEGVVLNIDGHAPTPADLPPPVVQDAWGGAQRRHEQYVAILSRGAGVPEEEGRAVDLDEDSELGPRKTGSGAASGLGSREGNDSAAGTGLAEGRSGRVVEVSERCDTQELRSIPLTARQELALLDPPVPGLQI